MKKKILLAVFLLVLIALLAAQLALGRGLERAVRERVEPALRERLQAEVHVGGVGVSLWRGAIRLRDVRIGNPAGFAEADCLRVESCEIRVGLEPLLRGRADEIREVTLRGVDLSLVRNPAGELNVARLAAGRGGRRRAGAWPPPSAGELAATLPRLSVLLGRFDGRLRLVDHAVSNRFELDLDAQATLRDIATWGDPTNLVGRVMVEASQAGNPDVFDMLLHIKLAPLLDPARPTFEVTGNLDDIPVKPLAPYLGDSGLEGGLVSGALRLACVAGELDPKTSQIDLTFQGPKLSDLARARLGSFAVPETFRMTLPMAGAIWAPQTDFRKAWDQALFSGENLGAIFEATDKAQTNKADILRNLLERGR
jgi:hypothetical protein